MEHICFTSNFVWIRTANVSNATIESLEQTQSELARMLLRAPRHTHKEVRLKECGMKPIRLVLDKLTIGYFMRTVQLEDDWMIKRILTGEVDKLQMRDLTLDAEIDDLLVIEKNDGLLPRVVKAAKRLNIQLHYLISKNVTKSRMIDAWNEQIKLTIAGSDRLQYYSNNYRPYMGNKWTEENWWLKARAGMLLPYSRKDGLDTPCLGCGERLTLQHILLECKEVEREQEDWIVDEMEEQLEEESIALLNAIIEEQEGEVEKEFMDESEEIHRNNSQTHTDDTPNHNLDMGSDHKLTDTDLALLDMLEDIYGKGNHRPPTAKVKHRVSQHEMGFFFWLFLNFFNRNKNPEDLNCSSNNLEDPSKVTDNLEDPNNKPHITTEVMIKNTKTLKFRLSENRNLEQQKHIGIFIRKIWNRWNDKFPLWDHTKPSVQGRPREIINEEEPEVLERVVMEDDSENAHLDGIATLMLTGSLSLLEVRHSLAETDN